LALARVLAEHHELVSREARDRVAVAHGLLEAPGGLDEHLVPRLVAKGVVDGLEVVEIEEEEREVAAAVRSPDRLLEAVKQQAAVGQPGEGVDEGKLREFRLRSPQQ